MTRPASPAGLAPAGRPAGAGGAFANSASTSSATMRPRGPDGEIAARSMPDSAASRRASGVTTVPPGSLAGPKLRSGVRTSRNGSSLMGASVAAGVGEGAEGGLGAAGASLRGAAAGAAAAGAGAAAVAPSPDTTATTAPTGTTSPSWTRISVSTPAEVAGTSIEVLSVSISNRLSPGATASPVVLNHLVILPSATVSPSCGIRMSIGACPVARPSPDQRDVLGLQKLHQSFMRAFAPDAALLHAAERRGRIGDETAVEADHAEVEPFRHPHAAAKIARVDIGDETILGVVRPLDHVLFRV